MVTKLQLTRKGQNVQTMDFSMNTESLILFR